MSKLYGTLQSERTGKVTRSANSVIAASLQSFDGSVSLSMNDKGIIFMFVDTGSTDKASKMIMATTIKELLNLAENDAMIKL